MGGTAPFRSGAASSGREALNPNVIKTLLIDGHDGSRIPLGQLAEIDQRYAY
jgi:hypothetical protein